MHHTLVGRREEPTAEPSPATEASPHWTTSLEEALDEPAIDLVISPRQARATPRLRSLALAPRQARARRDPARHEPADAEAIVERGGSAEPDARRRASAPRESRACRPPRRASTLGDGARTPRRRPALHAPPRERRVDRLSPQLDRQPPLAPHGPPRRRGIWLCGTPRPRSRAHVCRRPAARAIPMDVAILMRRRARSVARLPRAPTTARAHLRPPRRHGP